MAAAANAWRILKQNMRRQVGAQQRESEWHHCRHGFTNQQSTSAILCILQRVSLWLRRIFPLHIPI